MTAIAADATGAADVTVDGEAEVVVVEAAGRSDESKQFTDAHKARIKQARRLLIGAILLAARPPHS